jgi:hypothetical protein
MFLDGTPFGLDSSTHPQALALQSAALGTTVQNSWSSISVILPGAVT